MIERLITFGIDVFTITIEARQLGEAVAGAFVRLIFGGS